MLNRFSEHNGQDSGPEDHLTDENVLSVNAAKGGMKAFGKSRRALNTRFVYAVISQRANGLSIGVNLNPDKSCNFDCAYCEVSRDAPGVDQIVDVRTLGVELAHVLGLVYAGKLRELAEFSELPVGLLELKEVALSGDGEPTICPNFEAVTSEVIRQRAIGGFPHFKIVLITNATGLHLPEVARSLKRLGETDEIWAKLDAGTQEYMTQVSRTEVPLWRILGNILTVGLTRPVVIQSLFPQVDGQGPPLGEVEQYVQRLKELKTAGAQISLVQVYSSHRPAHRPNCEHLALRQLSHIARRVREVTGLNAQVY